MWYDGHDWLAFERTEGKLTDKIEKGKGGLCEGMSRIEGKNFQLMACDMECHWLIDSPKYNSNQRQLEKSRK